MGGHGIGGSSSNIKSIQRGNLNTAGYPSKDVTISPVNLSRAIVRIVGNYGTQTTPSNDMCTVKFKDSSTITIQMNGSGASVYVEWEVIELNNVKGIQSGSYTLTSNGYTPTQVVISAINPLKSIMFASVRTTYSTADVSPYQGYYDIIDSTHIGFCGSGVDSYYPKVFEWFVVEFN
jgi:hypothetical protein